MIASPKFVLLTSEGNPMVEGRGDENRGRHRTDQVSFFISYFLLLLGGSVML